jgi:prepilin-type N-terminal cleavage/methylation domain-containing protein
MEWNLMELSLREKCKSSASEQDGVTLIEMMIAMVVLAVGILGAMSLVITAISGDGRSKQQSNSTALTQMVTERIMAVAASNNATVTIADCTGTIYNVSTTGSSSGTGASLTSSGDVDFTQATVANYYMPYTDCATLYRQATYDVRWNIKTLSSYAKLLTVSARLRSVGSNARVYAPQVTIRTVVGQGT